jgi:hypothetical protein
LKVRFGAKAVKLLRQCRAPEQTRHFPLASEGQSLVSGLIESDQVSPSHCGVFDVIEGFTKPRILLSRRAAESCGRPIRPSVLVLIFTGIKQLAQKPQAHPVQAMAWEGATADQTIAP